MGTLTNQKYPLKYTSTDLITYTGALPDCVTAEYDSCDPKQRKLTELLNLLLIKYCETTPNPLTTDISEFDIECLLQANPEIEIGEDLELEDLLAYFRDHMCYIYGRLCAECDSGGGTTICEITTIIDGEEVEVTGTVCDFIQDLTDRVYALENPATGESCIAPTPDFSAEILMVGDNYLFKLVNLSNYNGGCPNSALYLITIRNEGGFIVKQESIEGNLDDAQTGLVIPSGEDYYSADIKITVQNKKCTSETLCPSEQLTQVDFLIPTTPVEPPETILLTEFCRERITQNIFTWDIAFDPDSYVSITYWSLTINADELCSTSGLVNEREFIISGEGVSSFSITGGTRYGLPNPPTIFSGGVKSSEPIDACIGTLESRVAIFTLQVNYLNNLGDESFAEFTYGITNESPAAQDCILGG